MVSQFYESQVYDEYVIKGNAAILKCNIPSFVSDHVEVVEWVDSNGSAYTRIDNTGTYTYTIRDRLKSTISWMAMIFIPLHEINFPLKRFDNKSYPMCSAVSPHEIPNFIQMIAI